MKLKHGVLVGVIMLAVLGSVGTARADAAPPPPPPAGSVEEGSEYPTNVQMVSEDVLMTIGDDLAYVKATFNMRNQGTTEESFDVRFPIDSYVGGRIETVHNFAAYVDGEPAEITYVPYPDENCTGCPLLHWATWRVTFPAGLPVALGVIYQVDPYYRGDPFQEYTYMLHTGAGWFGPIGDGTITVRLPYEINESDAIPPYQYVSPEYHTISGTDIIWQFTDLEPTEHDDVYVVIVPPAIWRDIQAAQQEVNENPDSFSAYLKLAHVLRRILGGKCPLHDAYYEQTAARAIDAYQRALELAPNNIDIHVDYVEFLGAGCAPPELIAPALMNALAVDPHNPRLLEIASMFARYLTPTATGGFPPTSDPNATASPTYSIPTLVPSSTQMSVFTLTPALMPTSAPPPADNSKIGVWVAIAAAVIGGAWVGVRAYRRRTR